MRRGKGNLYMEVHIYCDKSRVLINQLMPFNDSPGKVGTEAFLLVAPTVKRKSHVAGAVVTQSWGWVSCG